MQELVTVALSNAVVATLLAIVFFPLARWSNCSRCGHLLWIIVLLKLVTPPLFDLPVPVLPKQSRVQVPAAMDKTAKALSGLSHTSLPDEDRGGKIDSAHGETVETGRPSQIDGATPKIAFLYVWGFGALVYGLYQIYVTIQMGRLMRLATPHPRIDRAINRIARKAKVKNYPTARLVPWVGSPMLWGMSGTAVIVIPEGLFNSIDDDGVDTLLQHELAHFQRGDQWVRILEAVTSTIFWWHPLVWIAKREIEAFEEQCCDAWVVQHDYDNRRRYAEALLDTVDFISESQCPKTMPLAASGLGRVRLLEKRLTNIIRGDVPRLTAARALALLALFCLLPLYPSLTEASFPPAVSPLAMAPSDPLVELSGQVTPVREHSSAKQHSLETRYAQGIEYAKATAVYGTYQLTASTGHDVSLQHVVSGKNISLREHQIACVAFSPPSPLQVQGQQFVAGCDDGQVLLFDCASGEVVQRLADFGAPIRSIAYSTDGRLLAVAGQDGVILLIDMKNQELTRLPVPASTVSCVRFSDDGNHLVWVEDTTLRSSSQNQVEIWRIDSWQRTARVQCPASVGLAEFYGGMEQQIVTASWDGILCVWDGQALVSTIPVPKDVVSAAAFSTNAVSLNELIVGELESDHELIGFRTSPYE